MIADYVIVGAGSAGCVIANRLSADPSVRVVLLEAGGKDTNPWIHIPVGYFRTMHNPSVDWCYRTEPEAGLGGRSLDWPRGKVLGGSSSLNGLLYVRGQRQDYDRWRQMGNTGWGWDDVLPLFRRSEDQENGACDYHGTGGPLAVSNMPFRRPICDDWISAAHAIGFPRNDDCNGPTQEGVGYFQLTARNGRRCSSADAYLHPAMKRRNLKVITRAHATRLLFDGNRVTGLVYTDRNRAECEIRARGEVILAMGAIGSPQLLMLSGVGEAEHLRDVGIDVHTDLPMVGQNLQDHLQARLVFRCNQPTLNDDIRGPVNKARIGLQYLISRGGPMAMAASLATGFVRSRPDVETPDLQFHMQPWSADKPGRGTHRFSAFTMSVCQLRPESRGEIRLKNRHARTHPAIRPNYLATETDRRTLADGVAIARRIAATAPLANAISGEHSPGPEVTTDDDILNWLRQTATTIYHPTGTCRMGAPGQSVVDARLRVHGLRGLRIADCSIMPEIVSGNTNAPAIMIGEKASDMIIEDRRN